MSGHAGGETGRPSEARSWRHRDLGQATVEVALLVPFVALLALAVIQVGVLVHDQLLVTAAAREAVRAAAVSADDGDARRAAAAASARLRPDRLSVDVTRGSGTGVMVEVDVSYAAPTRVPLAGAFLPDVTLSAHAAMRSET